LAKLISSCEPRTQSSTNCRLPTVGWELNNFGLLCYLSDAGLFKRFVNYLKSFVKWRKVLAINKSMDKVFSRISRHALLSFGKTKFMFYSQIKREFGILIKCFSLQQLSR